MLGALAAARLFLGSPLGKFLMVLAAVSVVVGLVWKSGLDHQRRIDAAERARAEARAKLIEARQSAITSGLRAKLETDQAQTKERVVYLRSKVKEYVSAKDDAACRVGPGFVSLFNAAVAGQLPRTAGGSEGRSAAQGEPPH